MIFSQKEIIFVSFCSRNVSNVLEWRFHFENGILYKNLLPFYPSAEGIFLYFKICSLDMEKIFHKVFNNSNEGQKKGSILHWSNCKGAINSNFKKNCDKCGKLGPDPSAKNGLIHFLLGAMLPCSTPFPPLLLYAIEIRKRKCIFEFLKKCY